MKLETIPEPQEGQPIVRGAALLRPLPSPRLLASSSPNLLLVARTQRWVCLHPVSGFYSDPSPFMVFYYYYYYLKEKAGCHWLSSRAQTCCGHPVRPFTFFSVPKDSCRPSVCDTKNTPNYHHHQQQQQQQEATNKPQSVWTFSADYCISCCSAGQTKRKGKCGRLT